jgi:Mrp family chromosome partitioning ATPase
MSRMLAALKQLEARAAQPQRAPESAPPEEPAFPGRRPDEVPQVQTGTGTHRPARNDTAIEAALARVEIAAAALRPQQDQPHRDSSTASWPIPSTQHHARIYRQLAENVLSQVARGGPAVLMFTSPGDGDGKTELLVSLAAALAEQTAQPVLLLDANVRKPDLASCLGVKAARGLVHVLAGAASWQQVVQETSVPHLDLLPGVKSPTPDVGRPDQWNLRPLVDELRGRYRLVLVDTASLAHAEVAPMAGYCDGTYLVARLKHTTRRDLARAVEVIRGCRGRLLGSVVIGR